MTESNIERNARLTREAQARRVPLPDKGTTEDIRALYAKADWPEGEFTVRDGFLYTPDGWKVFRITDRQDEAAAAFIVEACNYWLKHLRGLPGDLK